MLNGNSTLFVSFFAGNNNLTFLVASVSPSPVKDKTVAHLLEEVDEWSQLLSPPAKQQENRAAAIEPEIKRNEDVVKPSSDTNFEFQSEKVRELLNKMQQEAEQEQGLKTQKQPAKPKQPQEVESYYAALRATLDDMFRAEKKKKGEQAEIRQQKLQQYRNRIQVGNSYSTQYGALPYGKYARVPLTTMKSDYLIPSGLATQQPNANVNADNTQEETETNFDNNENMDGMVATKRTKSPTQKRTTTPLKSPKSPKSPKQQTPVKTPTSQQKKVVIDEGNIEIMKSPIRNVSNVEYSSYVAWVSIYS